MSSRLLAIAVVVWALVTWGGRIGLLTGAEAASLVTWIRIAGSLLVAFLAGVALWLGGPNWALWLYAAFTGAIWLSSLFSVWTTEHPLGFRLVHTGLAAVSLLLAVLVGLTARR